MATFDSVNPARPSEVVGTYRVQGAADVDRAVAAAAEAQRRWARVPIPARAGVIVRAGAPGARRCRRSSARSCAGRPGPRSASSG